MNLPTIHFNEKEIKNNKKKKKKKKKKKNFY